MADAKREQVHNPQHDHGESVPTAADRMRFYGGATQERMNMEGESPAQFAKRTGAADSKYPVHIQMQAAQEVQSDRDRMTMARIANEATTAADYGDVATGRKKVLAKDHSLPAYKKGGVVDRTKVALVHKGELIIPAGEVHNPAAAQGGMFRCLPLEDRVVSDADRLHAKGYTGANAPWRR